MTTNLKVIELRGRGRPLGESHGEALRDLIRNHVQTSHDLYRDTLGAVADRPALLELSLKNAWILKRFSPIHYEELEGIAKGADVPLSEIFLINTFLELEDLKAPLLSHKLLPPNITPSPPKATEKKSGAAHPGPSSHPAAKAVTSSTSFNVKGRAASESLPLLGQTWDMEERMAPYGVVLKIICPDRRKVMVLTLAGVLGLCGLNDYGIALAANKLVALDAKEGVIQPVLVRKCLEQPRVGDSLGVLALAPRASSMAWQLSCGDGAAFCLETTATRQALLPFKSSLAHANHFLDPHLATDEAPGWLTHGGTWVRGDVAQERLDDFKGRIDVELLKTLCQDHLNNPLGICAHASDGSSELPKVATVAAVIMEPNSAAMHVSGPNPCLNVFETLSL